MRKFIVSIVTAAFVLAGPSAFAGGREGNGRTFHRVVNHHVQICHVKPGRPLEDAKCRWIANY